MVNVKMKVDSVSKQVNARIEFVALLETMIAAVKRRYIAGNGAYISFRAQTDLQTQKQTGSTLKSAAGKTQCVRKSQPGVNCLCSIA